MVQVVVAQPRGFCAGVVRAVKIVELALEKYGAPVYVKHPVVHNHFVVDRLERMGAITVDSVEDVPEGATVVFSAHGSPPGDHTKAADRNLRVIDAICPLVTRVHNEVKKYAREGRAIIVVGHSDHVEVIGTAGHSLEEHARTVTVDPDNVDLELVKGVVSGADVAVVTQTTLSQDDVAPAINAIKEQFPGAIIRNDICYATTNRQEAVKLLAGQVDMIFVIGSPTSSNCQRLVEVARKFDATPTYLVEGPEHLDIHPYGEAIGGLIAHMAALGMMCKIGITSGASTPEDLVEGVIAMLKPESVTYVDGPDENITFTLPEGLRE